MKSAVALILFGLVVCLATISARPNHDEMDLSNFDEESDFDHNIAQNRQHSRRQRRRHSRQTYDRYERCPSYCAYIQWAKIELLQQEIRELKDILKKSLSPPAGPATGEVVLQPIYILGSPIPYSVIPPIQTFTSNSCNKSNNVPDLKNRNQLGSDNNVINNDEDENDGGRPISFKPVNTNAPQGRPLPPVEHGSVQAGLQTETTTTVKPVKPVKTPGVCEAAILLCCRHPTNKHEECFQKYGCIKTFNTGLACSPRAIAIIIQHFKDAYAPS